jgi:hypothetical protein
MATFFAVPQDDFTSSAANPKSVTVSRNLARGSTELLP